MKPNEARARRAIVFLWINLALTVSSVFLAIFRLNILDKIESDNYDQDALRLGRLSETLDIVYSLSAFIISILTIICFIQWFRRAYYNLHFRSNTLEFSEGWAAGYWFIPFLNWYYPYKIMKEIFAETIAVLGKDEDTFPRGLLRAWWFFFVTGSIIDSIANRLAWNAETFEKLRTVSYLVIVSSVLLILAAIFAIRIIRIYNPLQQELYASSENDDISRHLAPEHESGIQF